MKRWPQEGQWTRCCGGKDHTTNIGKTLNGCGEWGGRKVNGPRDEGTGQKNNLKDGNDGQMDGS